MSSRQTTVTTLKTRATKARAPQGDGKSAVAAQPAAEQQQETADASERRVGDLLVVKDEPHPGPLGPGREFHGSRLLTLSDGSSRVACAQCPDVIGSWGEVRVHRRDEHGARIGGHRGGSKKATDSSDLPPEVADIPLGTLLEWGRDAPRWAELFEGQRERMAALAAENAALAQKLRAFERAFGRLGFAKMDEE